MQPPCQELVAKDIHDNTWTFRHIFRGFILFLTDSLAFVIRFLGFGFVIYYIRSTKKASANHRLECVC